MSSKKPFAFSWQGYQHKVPLFVENKSQQWVSYGVENDYPNYLLNLYRRSAKHNAIVNGKVGYIVGKGWTAENETPAAKAFIDSPTFPNAYDSMNDLTQKLTLDMEIYNGFACEVTWSRGGGIAEICHVDFHRIRADKDEKMFFIYDWYDEYGVRQFPQLNQIEQIPAFDPENRIGKQLFYYRVYSAGVKVYPLPEYLGGTAYIELDVEIANFHVNNIKNNFWGSYLINFPNGIPTPEESDAIERQMKMKFGGTDNAGRFLVNFSDSPETKPELTPLTPSDLDKQFDILNKTVQQEIFVAHRVTSPMLFGVKTEGQLGGRAEMIESYEIFKATYVEDRVQRIERGINYLASFNGVTGLKLQPTEPIAEQLTEMALLQIATKDELREKAGLPILETEELGGARLVADAINALSPLVANKVLESMSPNEIRALAALPPKAEGEALPESTGAALPVGEQQLTNGVLRSLSGREYQGMMRVVRQFTQGKLSKEQASLMLMNAYGLNDEECNIMLGIDEDPATEFSQQFETFADYGEGVRNNAKRGIELNEKNGNKCATQTGKVRAQQLANGEGISLETIKRMHSYLSRAETYYDNADSQSDCGYISYLLWGGKAALGWSRNKLRELGELDEMEAFESVAMEFGVNADDYQVLRSKPVRFAADTSVMAEFMEVEPENKALDKRILAEIKRTKKVDADAISRRLDAPLEKVSERIEYLISKGQVTIQDRVARIADTPDTEAEEAFEIRYKYDLRPELKGSEPMLIDGSRDFCRTLVRLNKLYTRQDIDQMSTIMGYSVWDRRGEWYTLPGTNVSRPSCRHIWQQQIVVRKGNKIELV